MHNQVTFVKGANHIGYMINHKMICYWEWDFRNPKLMNQSIIMNYYI